jgi:predicted DNA-binding transcriptional regulator YafY
MRAGRLLSILLLLQKHRRVTARELAERLEVSERTILRDMDALSGSGVPVIAERGKGGGWSLLDDYQTKLTGFSPAEIQALFLARPARLMADLGLKHESEAALIKLEASLPAGAREQAELARRRIHIDPRGWRDPAEAIPCLPVLFDTVWRGKQVRFLYARELGETSERAGHPLGLVVKGSTWYLIATVGGETRTYRVSRIREAAALDQPAEYPPDFDLAAYWGRSAAEFREKLPRYYATYLANPSVMRWIRYRGWRLEEELPEGDRVRVRLRFDIEDEAIQFGLSFGGDMEVLEPAELREKVLAAAQAILDRSCTRTPSRTPAGPGRGVVAK